jgi:peptidoglycan/xylan/chitin deacetylase (PgdA/CDA1 family)
VGAILCFHSVTTDEAPAEGSAHVTLNAFRSLIRTARTLGTLVPLSELTRRHAEARSTAGLVAVTLDDAYATLHGEFRKVVRREGIPISIFAVASAFAAPARFWWDRIDDLFPRVPANRWNQFERSCGLPAEYRRGQPKEHGPLRPLRQWLLARYAGRWPLELEPALAALEEETGFRTHQRPMTLEEMTDLARLPSVEIGVHTTSHPVLPLLSDQELTDEIAGCYDQLRQRFSSVLPILAIPFGLFDQRTLRLARAAGMDGSLTLAGSRIDCRSQENGWPRFCITSSDTPAKLALRLVGLPDLRRRWLGRSAPAPFPDLPSATT